MVTSSVILDQLSKELDALRQSPLHFQAFTGFDGFVDKIQKAVKTKQGAKNSFFETIQDFSGHLASLGGRSGQVEIVTVKTKVGGNAPILSNTFANLAIRSFCLGAMGYPDLHPVFKQMHANVEKFSPLAPGVSQALEFNDGKVILSELDSFKEYNWKDIKLKCDISTIQKAVNQSQVIALVDWANLPLASDIWQGFLDDVIKPSGKRDWLFLFDLCDPSRKSTLEIDEVLDLISDFSAYGKVTLGLNENEANKIWIALNGNDSAAAWRLPNLKETGSFIYHTMNIDALLIHPINRTLVFQKHEKLELLGRVVKEPKVQTGGGDNLNAGYCLGRLHGLSIAHCMLLGMAASGAYIQNGRTPNLYDLISYVKIWSEEIRTYAYTH